MTIPPVTSHLKPASAMDNAGVRPNKAVFKLPKARDQSVPMEQQLRPIAQVLVGQTFFGTLLKQTEDNPFKDDRLTGGKEGKMFNSMYHQRLAEQMIKGSGRKLVDAVVKNIVRKFDHQKVTG